ncbi:myosin light chain kinase, smooth muscle isoform X1 [Petromyzon marinus]|uniref:myosin light chain kinase, smooth muscle isoform X1 n=1 Tax=Petromyzon marinus TaxID=7757 RepID=UPI003F728B3E
MQGRDDVAWTMMADNQISAKSSPSRVSKATLTLELTSAARPPMEPPAFAVAPRNARAPLGATARFDGKVRGNPEPQVLWFKNGQPLVAGEHFRVERSSRGAFSLEVVGLGEDDSGKYLCEARNEAGTRQITVELKVEGCDAEKKSLVASAKLSRFPIPPVESRPSIWGESPPKFVNKPSRAVVREGQGGKFNCKITGRPQPQVTWRKGDTELHNDGHFKVYEKSSLHFLEVLDVKEEDSGVYTCTITNSAGKASASAELIIQISNEPPSVLKPHLNVQKSSTELTLQVTNKKERNTEEAESKKQTMKIVTQEVAERREAAPMEASKKPSAAMEMKMTNEQLLRSADRIKPASNVLQKTELPAQPAERKSAFQKIQIKSLAVKETETRASIPDVVRRKESGGNEGVAADLPQVNPAGLSGVDVKSTVSKEMGRDAVVAVATETTEPPPKGLVERNEAASKKLPKLTMTQKDAERKVAVHKEVEQKPLERKRVESQYVAPKDVANINAPAEMKMTGMALREESKKENSMSPVFTHPPQSREVTQGHEVAFSCRVSGIPKPAVEWSKDGVVIKTSERWAVEENQGGHQLIIFDVQKYDGGAFACAAKNSDGKATTATFTLIVKDADQAPGFSAPLVACTVEEQQEFTLECHLLGKPEPSVTWLKDDKPVNSAVMSCRDGYCTLYVGAAGLDDGGVYTCKAENHLGKAYCSATVTVREPRRRTSRRNEEKPAVKQSPPVFVKGLCDLQVMDGSEVHLTVKVAAIPPAEIVWLHNGNEIKESEDFVLESKDDEHTLHIQEVFPEDTGCYTCEAWNEAGQAQSQALLTVQEPQDGVQPWFISKPRPAEAAPGQSALLSCAVAGDPFPSVSWHRDGRLLSTGGDTVLQRHGDVFSVVMHNVSPEHTGLYEVRIQNTVGSSNCTVSLVVKEGGGRGSVHQRWGRDSESLCSSTNVRQSCSPSGENPEQQWECKGSEPDQTDFRGVLRRKVQTKERLEEVQKQQEAEQKDFRSVLSGAAKKSCSTKHSSEEESQQREAEQLDFRGNLSRRVKTKSLCEEEIKEREAEQVDFRATLACKKAPSRKPPPPAPKPKQPSFRRIHLQDCGDPPEQEPEQCSSETSHPGCFSGCGSSSLCSESDPQHCPTECDTQDGPRCQSRPASARCLTESAGGGGGGMASSKGCTKGSNGCCETVSPGGISRGGGGGSGGSGGDEQALPVFTEPLRVTRVLDGERLQLQCRVSGRPPLTDTWSVDGKVLKPSKYIMITQKGDLCLLTIDEVLPEDEGKYTCSVENRAGKAQTSAMVYIDDPASLVKPKISKLKTNEPKSQVSAVENDGPVIPKKKPTPKISAKPDATHSTACAPQITRFPEDMKVRAGEMVDLMCSFEGTPPIKASWLRFKKEIAAGGRLKIETKDASSSRLTISSSQHNDCGCYTLVLENKHGSTQALVGVTIVDKPEPPAGQPCASDIRESSLTLSWYGPTYDGGSLVQSYTVEVQGEGESRWKELTSTCHSTSYNVQGLDPQKQYKFRVRAANIYGISEPSQESPLVSPGIVNAVKAEEEFSDDDEKENETRDYGHVSINPNKKLNDLYDVKERLGTGRFGQVFKLVEKKSGKTFAGKFIKALTAKDKESIHQEIALMNSLHHPKLVQCVDAFESKTDIIMVLELISGGELFERIIDEDFELTERECIKYMRQIVEGVQFMHRQGIVHLDLKPENIMCLNQTGNRIKIIDFGLARKLENVKNLKVMFGTPEFVAPEVINYEPIGYATDMWSVGVICYILVSGLSPLMGDNDNETLANVTSATWDFDDEAFDEISEDSKDFISHLLQKNMKERLTCTQCVEHPWLQMDTEHMAAKKLSKERMKRYLTKRKWQKTGNAVRALGRLSSMAMLGIGGKRTSGVSPPSPKSPPAINDVSVTPDSPTVNPLSRVAEEKSKTKPYFSKKMKDAKMVPGSSARFECKIEGYPDPEVIWFRNGQPIKESRQLQIEYDEEGNCSLIITDGSELNGSTFICKAINGLGEATCSARLLANK